MAVVPHAHVQYIVQHNTSQSFKNRDNHSSNYYLLPLLELVFSFVQQSYNDETQAAENCHSPVGWFALPNGFDGEVKHTTHHTKQRMNKY